MLNAKLMVVGGDAKPSEIQLRLPTVIGRGREATLTLPHPLVSRQHTEIFEQDGRLMVRDLGSLNGTFVNNQKIESDQVLEPNQLLTLGNVTFRAVYEVTDEPQGEQLPAAQSIEVSVKVGQEEGTEVDPTKADNEATGPVESGGLCKTKTDSDANGGSAHYQNVRAAAGSVTGGVSIGRGQNVSPDSALSSLSSLGSLDGLPAAASSIIELAEPLELGSQPQAASAIDPAEFQFDESGDPSAIDPSQSDLGSFLKKLPR
ncbi:FHA domain-containing protein [Mariniblastus sp.]|nr:FHA domain-containing protein [Mariniblastus sp.]